MTDAPRPLPGIFLPSFQRELATMVPVVVETGLWLLKQQQKPVKITTKPDGSVVTPHDEESSRRLGEALASLFPGDAVLDEEFGARPWNGRRFLPRCWFVDPLDSTSSYIRGGAHWGVLLGMVREGIPEFGITYKPAQGQLAFAARGQGAYLLEKCHELSCLRNGLGEARSLKVRRDQDLDILVSGRRRTERLETMLSALSSATVTSMSGSLKMVELALGMHTAFVCPPGNRMALWDLCACQVILEEAGGMLTDLNGRPIDYLEDDPVWEGGLLASNGTVHKPLLEALSA